ncbi:MAG: hypothetical protein QGH34_02680 [Candidatus Woesearchaeota archaeon]|nr:hypothetical protein [Candidatus Woesearchaeota archaeon]
MNKKFILYSLFLITLVLVISCGSKDEQSEADPSNLVDFPVQPQNPAPAADTTGGELVGDSGTEIKDINEEVLEEFENLAKNRVSYKVTYDATTSSEEGTITSEIGIYLKYVNDEFKQKIESITKADVMTSFHSIGTVSDFNSYTCSRGLELESPFCLSVSSKDAPSKPELSVAEEVKEYEDFEFSKDGTIKFIGITTQCYKWSYNNLAFDTKVCVTKDGVPLYYKVIHDGDTALEWIAKSYTTDVKDSDVALPAGAEIVSMGDLTQGIGDLPQGGIG